jgi:hypothetical protein
MTANLREHTKMSVDLAIEIEGLKGTLEDITD